MPKVAERVRQSSLSTGTGNFTLSGTYQGFQSFSEVFSVGDTTYYVIADDLGNWEVGIGTYSSANTLTRNIVYESSNGDAKVTFPAGDKRVFVSYPAARSITSDQTVALAIALG
tara:strand:- start:17056 stop:17397 length:342 start_codon:yes stop_codon:yes gene_type:complete